VGANTVLLWARYWSTIDIEQEDDNEHNDTEQNQFHSVVFKITFSVIEKKWKLLSGVID